MKIFLALLFTVPLWNFCNATIDVMVKTSECIVFASDSRISDINESLITSDTYEKIVPVCKTIMSQMQGTALINGRTFRAFINDLKYHYNIDMQSIIYVDSFNTILLDYCNLLKSMNVKFGTLLISIAGVDSSGTLKLYGIRPAKDSILYERFPNAYTTGYFGMNRVASYLTRGFSPTELSKDTIIRIVREELQLDSITDTIEMQPKIKRLENRLDSLFLFAGPNVNEMRFSIQDAVEYAYYLVKITTLIDRLSYGSYGNSKNTLPTTGGDILVGLLTQEGFSWIELPQYGLK